MSVDPKHQEFVDKYFEAASHHDLDIIVPMYEEDATLGDPGAAVKGHDAIRQVYEGYFKAFPDVNSQVTHLMSAGDYFVVEFTLQGTHTGPLLTEQGEVPPTGRKFEVPVCFIGRVSENGLLAEDRTYFDMGRLMAQLGFELVPPKEEGGE